MIRLFAIAIGISTVRIFDAILLAATHASPRALVGPWFWFGWLLTLVAAELWIRRTRAWADRAGVLALGASSAA